MVGVKVQTERAGGRTFTMSGRQGQVSDRESNLSLDGDVHITSSDGLDLRTDHAVYTERDGVATAPGSIEFSRGRMNGSGVGLTYDKNRDALSILQRVAIRMAPGEDGTAPTDVTAEAARFDRPAKTIFFDGAFKATRGVETAQAANAVAHLTEDEQKLR